MKRLLRSLTILAATGLVAPSSACSLSPFPTASPEALTGNGQVVGTSAGWRNGLRARRRCLFRFATAN